ncbi:Reverse transcriptase domain [Cinara cedri]|uniref:Reverse transcriptase domain n=1 Tax=Cinara cedri TaxID=506608 RepID=A0A5E4MJM9_9HEMI|nr:Reverse transcriptase domain [Cinara cedri]
MHLKVSCLRTKKQKSAPTCLKKSDGTWCKSDKEKAELFCSHLSEVFKHHQPTSNVTFSKTIESSLNSVLPLYLAPKPFLPGAVLRFINTFPLKKSPGIDLITAEVARQLPKTALIHLTHILNSILRLSYFPIQWKVSLIILIPKPGKPPDTPSSYRPISLLHFFVKLCEKMILKRISNIINDKKIIPCTQFGFQDKHSTIHQVHRLIDSIAYSLETKSHCSAVLLDVAQAFDRVWHPGLLHKLKIILPPPYYLFFKSYLEDRFFAVKVGSEISNLAPILAGVPQGAISSPILFNIYTSDQPTTSQTSVADFADDKVIYISEKNPFLASQYLQNHLNLLSDWYSNWRIKINNDKSSHITFTLKQSTVPPVYLNNKVIPSSSNVKYLGLTLDKRLTWALHIKQKRFLLNARRRALFPLIGRQAKTDLKTKLLLYKTLLKPIWLYGIQLWGAVKKSNTYKIQAFQSTSLRMIIGAPPYISNHTLHSDLKILTVHDEAKNAYRLFRARLTNHSNPLIRVLNSNSIPDNPPRRLKRNWNRDL